MAEIESNIRFNVDTSDAMASIKALQSQISAFQRQMASSSVANAESARKLRRGLLDDLNATGQWSASIRTIESSSDSFTRSLEKNKLSMGEYFRYAGSQTTAFGRLFTSEFNTIEKVARERVKTLQTQYISLGRDANGALQSISVRPLRLDMNDLATQTAMNAQRQQIFNQLLKQGSTNLLNFGKNTQWAGRQLMVGFTVPLSIFGSMASKTFMQLEEQAIRFKRVYGELFTPPEEADQMLETLKELGKEFTKYGVAVEKTLGLAADAAAMGKTGTELLDQVTEANRLAVLGNVEQAQALETTISITNAFGVATEDLAKKIDFLNAVENQTVTSIEDLTIAVPKAGPVIQQLGGNVEDLAFFLTAMKEGGINASEGANALKSGLASIINPTQQASTMLKVFGINLQEINAANRGDVKGLVLDFAEALDELNPSQRAQAIEQLFGKFQFARLSTLFQNVIQDGTQAQRVLEITNATTQELAQLSDRELKRVEESTTFRFRKAVEEFQVAIAPVGEEFLKLITPIIEFATKIIEKFNGLSDGAKSFITGLTVLFGAIGPVAIMTFGLLANGIANIIKGFTFIRDLFMRTGKQSTILGEQFDYMTTEQLNAAAVAASLDQVHQNLIQVFSTEAGAVQRLGDAYRKAFNEQQRFDTGRNLAKQAGLKLANGIVSVPGPKGAGDIVPAVLSPGEAVIPADAARKYAPIIQGMIAGNLPGFSQGVMLGMPRSGKSTQRNREAAEEVYQMFLQSSYKDVPPTEYGHQLAKTSGHSFPIFGLGGVYMGPNGKKVFVKPVMDEKAALAEMRATEIARRAHGLKAPEQRIVVMRDPMDPKRQRRFLALESALDATFVNDDPMALFNEDQYFRQLVASLVRVDKDLSASNVFGDVVADVGPAGVFSRASGLRDYAEALPSMEEQAMINLLGIKGGAKRAFAESTVGLMQSLNPQQYHQRMIGEIQRVLPLLEQTVASFNLTSPQEAKAYQDMIQRLRQGLSVDWSKFHSIHSAVKPSKPKQTTIPGYADGVVSVPGPKGAGDVMPAMLSPGEAVIPADKAKKYAGFIQQMIYGKIPGYQNSNVKRQTQSVEMFKQEGQLSMQASHYDFAAPGVLADTLTELTDELGDFSVRVYQISEKLEDGSRNLEVVEEKLADLAGRDIDMAASGRVYGATTKLETKDRNQAYRVAGIEGTPFTLDGVVAAGKKAEEALLLTTKEALKYRAEFETMVREAGIASQILSSDNSSQERLSFMVNNAKESLVQAYRSGTSTAGKVKSIEEARALASAKVAEITDKYRILVESGMDEVLALQAAERELKAEMLKASGVYSAGPSGTSGNILRDVNTSRASFNPESSRGRLNSLTPEGVPKLPSAGLDTAVVATAFFQDLQERGYDETSAALEMVKSGVIRALERGLGINSPSAEYENISDSVTAGVRQGSDDAQQAGQMIGESISDAALGTVGSGGAVKVGRRRVSTDPAAIAAFREAQGGNQAASARKVRRRATSESVSLGPGIVGSVDPATGEFVESVRTVTEENENVAKATQSTANRLDRMNSVLMQGTFALTSLAGAGVMAGGAIGEVSQKIFEFSGLLFGLMQITQLLTQTKIAAIAAERLSIAKQAMAFATYGAGVVASTGFTGSLIRAGIAVNAFLGPIGWITLAITAAVGGIMLLAGYMEDQKKKISGLGDVAFLTSEKMSKAAELLGFTAKVNAFGQNIKAGTAAADSSQEADLISQIRSNDSFKTDFANEINTIKNASIADAEAALASVSNQLFAAGADQSQVQAYVKALAQEAGRTDLSFEFASIDFTKQGKDQIIASAKSLAKEYQDAFKKGTTTVVTQDQTGGNRKVITSMTDEAKASMQAFSGTIASSFDALKNGFANGLMSAKDFNDGLAGVMNTLNGLTADELDLVLPDLYKKLGVEDLMKEIPNVKDQLLLLQADAAGITVTDVEKNALKNADKSAKAASVALRVRTKLAKQVKEQADAQEKLNKQAAQEELINEQIGAANTQLADRVTQLQNQSEAYQILIDQGYTAEQAFDLAGDAGLAAGIKAAYGAGLASDDWKDLKNLLDQVIDLEAKAPKSPTSGGGNKSPFQEAIDSLKEQRKEILESNAAFNKLRKAGFDTASAMKAAEDPILATAIATTKVGTKNWEDLISRIRQTQKLLSKKEMQDLLRGGKVEIADRRAQATVSNALTTLGYTAEQIDEVLSDQEFTNTLAKDLKDGKIDAKEVFQRLAQIKQLGQIDVEIAFATKEGAADEFQKRYDKVVGFLEAQKQTIEVDFQINTFDDQMVIRDAEQAIALINDKIDDYEAQLTDIEEQENVINEAYDKRKKALDDVSKANDAIARQQKNQLTLADALSQGDIAAAAKAAQDMRAQAAQDNLAKQSDLLEVSREKQLANLRSADGKTRKQLEEDIKKLKKDIFKIEEETIEPARQRIRDAEYEKRVKLDSLDQQILSWEKLAARVNEAKLKLTPEEMSAMKYQAGLIADLLENWNNIEDKKAILTIIKKTISGDDETQQDTTEEKPVVPTTTSTTSSTSSSSSSSSSDSKGPGPKPPYSPGAGKTWKVVNNKWTAVDVPGPGPKPPVSPGVGKKWQLVGNKWTAVPVAPQSSVSAGAPPIPSLIPPKPPVSPGTGKKWELVNNQWKAVEIPKNALQQIDDAINWLGDITGFKNNMNQFFGTKLASGGMVKRYAAGGFAMGTDIIPSMLTPGEFVVRRNAVQNFGVDKLKAINSGTYKGDSMYNYEINVSVQTDANPDQIAKAVIGQIRQMDSQRIRGNRF